MKDILSRVFEITRDSRDGVLFLQEFQSLSPESFAILYADSETIFESSEALFSDLKLLYQLDLYPLVIFEEDSFQYLKAFFPFDTQTQETNKNLGFSYEIIKRENPLKEEVLNCILNRKIPILLWNDEIEKLSPLLDRCCHILKSSKIIFVSIDGPIKDATTQKVTSILQTIEREESLNPKNQDVSKKFGLLDSISLTSSQKEFLDVSYDLVSRSTDPKFNLVLTSPFTLLTELFTVKGSGTLVKKKNNILKIESTADVNMDRVFTLIEDSFGKKLKPEFYKTKFDILFLEEHYRACAWLIKTEYGFLLSKFAVNSLARGAGVGRDIWDQILLNCRPLFWRSKPENTINKWYMSIAQGIEKDENWYYYWLGQKTETIPKIIEILKEEPEDFFPK